MKHAKQLMSLLAVVLMLAVSACAQAKAPKGVTEPANDDQYRPGMKVETPTLIDFNATWCPPCRLFGPAFDKAADDFAGKIHFVAIDVDKYRATANAFGIQSIPTIMLMMPDGTVTTYVGIGDFVTGLDPEDNPSEAEITDTIAKNLAEVLTQKLK